MKNNKGFTLVELLVIIVLLGVVAIIAFGSLNKGGDNAKQALLDNKLENIENAAVLHGQDNKDKFTATCVNPEDECCKVCNGIDNCSCYSDGDNIGIKVEELINAGVLKPDQDSTGEIKIKNPINNNKLDDEKVIIYQKYDKIYATIEKDDLKSEGSNGGSYKPATTLKVDVNTPGTLANVIIDNAKNTAENRTKYQESPSTDPGNQISTETEKTLSTAEDDYGTSYYFRGNVIDNYINFANKCWRIVRIQGDGSIKLILEDQDEECEENIDGNWDIPTSEGTDQGKYGSVHGKNFYLNAVSATDMANVFKNFQNNFSATELNKMKKGFWCVADIAYEDSDKMTNILTEEKIHENIIKNTNFYYESYIRLEGTTEKITSLKCHSQNKVTKFKDNSDMYVATVTADEVAYAGATTNISNKNFYLYNNYQNNNSASWWTLSQTRYSNATNGYDQNAYLLKYGGILNDYAYDSNCSRVPSKCTSFRPAIILKAGTEYSSGNGEINNPYKIK